MDNVFFTPYIGPNYPQGYKGKKILALGESHYINMTTKAATIFTTIPSCATSRATSSSVTSTISVAE